MDLRVKRTLISIKEAFYSLRKRKSVDKITVKELSEVAMINKATFYLHYRDIYDLSDKLQESLIDEIIEESINEVVDTDTEYSAYTHLTKNIIYAVAKRREDIIILFTRNSNEFIKRLEKKLKAVIFTLVPEYKNNVEKNILLSFIIHGSYGASLGNYNCSYEEAISCISGFSLKLLRT